MKPNPRTLLPAFLRVLPAFLAAALLAAGGPATAATHQVQVLAGGFLPPSVAAEVGDLIVWTNASGAAHNVVADDGGFASGALSAGAWTYTRQFSEPGFHSYHSEGAGGFTGTILVAGLFADGLEGGTTFAWDVTDPDFHCDCYFSGDCQAFQFCNWGVLSEEDNCEWMQVKPKGVPGAGCNVLYPFPTWMGGLCDGKCSLPGAGSIPGAEERNLVREAVGLWTGAILGPALRPGGGPVDPVLAGQALGLPFANADAAIQIGRQVADLLLLAGVPQLYMHFCRWEASPEIVDPSLWPDLSRDPCRAALAGVLADALVAEIGSPGAGAAILARRPAVCHGSATAFGCEACPDGQPACVADRVAGLAELLSTPPGGDPLRKALAGPALLPGPR